MDKKTEEYKIAQYLVKYVLPEFSDKDQTVVAEAFFVFGVSLLIAIGHPNFKSLVLSAIKAKQESKDWIN